MSTQAAERSIAETLARYYGKLAGEEPVDAGRRFRFSRLFAVESPLTMDAMRMSRSETEFSEVAAARAAAKAYGDGEGKLRLPTWSCLSSRTMTDSPGSKGGYLMPTQGGEFVEAFGGWEPILAAARYEDVGTGGSILFPREVSAATGSWYVPGSGAPLSGTDVTLGAVSSSMKSYGVVVPFPHQLARQANIDAILRRHIGRRVARETARVILDGDGGIEPRGTLNTTGIGSISGTSLDWSDICGMLETVGTNADDSGAVWIADLATRELLQQREGLTGSGRAIWETNDTICGRRAIASSIVPAGTLLLGNFDCLLVPLYGTPRVETDLGYDFNKAVVAIRLLIDCDVVVTDPGAFCKAVSVS